MTSGVKGSSSIPGESSDSSLKGTFTYREWTGDNGKYSGNTTFPVKWNNYTCYQDSETISNSYFRFVCTRPGGGGSGSLFHPPDTPYRRFPSEAESSVTANDINKALNRILGQAKGHSFNLGVELGQARQTINLVVGNLGKLGRAALALRRGDFSNAARQLGATPRTSRLKAKDVSGRWLELQYGWFPLVQSSYEAAQAYKAVSDGPRTATFNTSVSRKSTYWYTSSANGVNAKQAFTDRRAYTFEMSEELSLPRQLGLADPLSIAWELTLFSFVVDWFIPIGTYLDNLNQIPKLKGRWLVSRKLSTSGGYDWAWVGGYPSCGYHGSHPYDSMTHKVRKSRSGAYISRGILFSPPAVPTPVFQPLSGALSPRRVWNAIALAHQRFTG